LGESDGIEGIILIYWF